MMYVITYNEIIGCHKWEQATGRYSYLSKKHRHVFKIRCWFSVTDDNREIEINEKQYEIENGIKNDFEFSDELGVQFGNMSCEMICRYIIDKYGCTGCEVLEDGFGGSIVWN